MFNLKDFIEDQQEGEVSTEVDLSPLLALMVTLIPVLLLQTSFATLKMLETSLPILSDRVQEEKKKEDDKDKIEFDLNVFIKNDKSVVVETIVNKNKVESKTFKPTSDSQMNLDLIKKEILGIKTKYPEQAGAKVTPDDEIKYDEIVKMLDVIRRSDNAQAIKYKNKEGVEVETTMLFPDVVFGNISE